MVGLDTNVLVRYLTHDDEEQFRVVTALLHGLEKQGQSAYISSITLCETVWVLSRAYKIERAHISGMLDKLLHISLFVINDKDAVREALQLFRTGKGDFADYLVGVSSRNAGSLIVATFDEALHQHENLFCAPSAALGKK